MRITNSGMQSSYIQDVQKSLQTMNKYNTQLTTQQKINKVSDDPMKAIKLMNLQNEISTADKFNYNCDEVMGWMDTMDNALDQMGNLTTEIKTLLTSVGDTLTEKEVSAINKEITEKVKQMAEAFNATYSGKYIFAGTSTDERPVNIVTNNDGSISIEMNQNINMDSLKTEVSNGITLDYNLNFNQITGAGDLFNTLNDTMKALSKNPVDMNEVLKLKEKLEDNTKTILDCRSIVGAKSNSIENIKKKNEENIIALQEVKSLTNDVDIAETATRLKSAELAYNACIQVGAKMFQSTILDYIR